MKKEIPLGWIFFGLIVIYIVYTWLYDDTRVSHPNYRSSTAYTACIRASERIYRERLEEGLVNPDLWRLAGYENAQAYARTSQRLARSRCEP